ncbi:hypothetical protein BJ138DRAFT_1160909 [Hygrophoropsis aurantiaca]|uniref:Uncharacterized protein n=1 Tax=Hygrophoropsis aurantiaca TaxID=72124 RepID=A0ACB8A187_9AGAM|nr:hypothetical protein BJ138DRAFT_1160909 [Hygrophoropsis aurantiaca]
MASGPTRYHALGLCRDSSRGRTHIIFFNAIYTPHASRDMMHKSQIDSAGVYRISDVMLEIESMMCVNPGEGKEYIDYHLNWRLTMDKDAPPAAMRLPRQGIQDVEHIF